MTPAPVARPSGRPEFSYARALELARTMGLDDSKHRLIVVARRGYYRDTLGAEGRNDLGIYDDAMAVLYRDRCATFNINTDPARQRQDMATLECGIWKFGPLIHNHSKPSPPAVRYPAFGQVAPVIVRRWGTESVPEGHQDHRGVCLGGGRWTGFFGIHLHKGGNTTTASEGCQTTVPDQWEEAHALLTTELQRIGAPSFPYVLTQYENV